MINMRKETFPESVTKARRLFAWKNLGVVHESDLNLSSSSDMSTKPPRHDARVLLLNEIEEEIYPSWANLDEAVNKLQVEDDKLAHLVEKLYNGTFANRRDLTLLRYFKEYSKEDK